MADVLVALAPSPIAIADVPKAIEFHPKPTARLPLDKE